MNFYSGLGAGLLPLALGRPYRWYYVRPRFQTFLENLKITEDQAKDGQIKHQGIVSCLNRAYWACGTERGRKPGSMTSACTICDTRSQAKPWPGTLRYRRWQGCLDIQTRR